MSAQILDGKLQATAIKNEVAQTIKQIIKNGGTAPGLAVVLVGKDPASEVYVRHKRQACATVGIHSFSHDLAENISQEELLTLIDQLNHDAAVSGILGELPLPEHIDSKLVLEKIHPYKDVDGFHPYNFGRLAQNYPLLQPCTPYGIITLLQRYNIHPKGMDTVIVGASNIVGRPLALEFLAARATITVCHRFTKDAQSPCDDSRDTSSSNWAS